MIIYSLLYSKGLFAILLYLSSATTDTDDQVHAYFQHKNNDRNNDNAWLNMLENRINVVYINLHNNFVYPKRSFVYSKLTSEVYNKIRKIYHLNQYEIIILYCNTA